MKFFGTLCLVLSVFFVQAQDDDAYTNPLSAYSTDWNNPDFEKCNTGDVIDYMTDQEIEVIYILNLVRTNPSLFAKTVLTKYPKMNPASRININSSYYKSLMKTLLSAAPGSILKPDIISYESAECHAQTTGKSGYVGHERKSKDCKAKKYFMGECCDYGQNDPLGIVLDLLIDQDVPSLGHRTICLGNYSKIGVSIEPHTKWRFVSVLDFN